MLEIFMNNFEKAEIIGNNPKLLRKRLDEHKACLKDEYLKDFKHPKFDFENKCLIGDNYVIKWFNHGINSVGKCGLFKKGILK